MNPYESPLSECYPPSPGEVDPPVPDAWLVSLSLLLAILIEIFPTEADLFAVYKLKGAGILFFLTVKTIALAIILAPLTVYIMRYGKRGIQSVKGRITAIGIIIVASFLIHLFGILT